METIGGFSFTEYLAVFVSIICGYITSEYLSGWGRLFRHRTSITVDVKYLLLTTLTFILFIDFWWSTWVNYSSITADIYKFILFLTIPFCFFLFTIVLFPSENSVPQFDSKKHYTETYRYFYSTIIILMVVSSIVANVMLDQGFWALENVFRFIAISVSILLIALKGNRRVLTGVLVIAYAVIVMNFVFNR